MEKSNLGRRSFVKKTALASGSIIVVHVAPFQIISARPDLNEEIIGHGDFRYRIERSWGNLDSKKNPVNNCHEMVLDKSNRLFLLDDHQRKKEFYSGYSLIGRAIGMAEICGLEQGIRQIS